MKIMKLMKENHLAFFMSFMRLMVNALYTLSTSSSRAASA